MQNYLYGTIGLKNPDKVDFDPDMNFNDLYIMPSDSCYTRDGTHMFFLSKPYSCDFTKQFLFKIISLEEVKKKETPFEKKNEYILNVVDTKDIKKQITIIKHSYNRFDENGKIVKYTEEQDNMYIYVTCLGIKLTKEEIPSDWGESEDTLNALCGLERYYVNINLYKEKYIK
jgi:hypothetical protein